MRLICGREIHLGLMKNNVWSVAGILMLLSFMITAGPLAAQSPFLAGTATKSTVAVGEQFQITFSLNTGGRSFQGPDLRDFVVLSGPNQSTNMQFVNGNISQSISFSYYLQAKATGTFKIGPASIEADGKRIASNVIQINVVKGNPSNQSQGQAQQGNRQQNNSGGLSDKNIFARAVVSKNSVMKGESLLLTFKLYSNVNIMDFAIPKMPSMDGFWNQEIQLPQNLERNVEIVDGQRYTVWEIKKLVLFPQQTGVLSIDPMELECIARIKVQRQQSNDPFSIFNDPFFGMSNVQDVKYQFKSQPIKVTVRDLPPNPPAGFGGAVGNLNFDAFVDRTETKTNEPVTLKIKISGNGNLKLAEVDSPELPPDLESYDPKIGENYKASESGVNGTKSFEYLIIPRHEGDYEIPAITFSYYNLSKKQYVSKQAGPFRIKVGKGAAGSSAGISASPGEKSEFKLIGSDIRYIKTNTPAFSIGDGLRFGTPGYYSLALLPFVIFGGLATWVRMRNKSMGNAAALRVKNATGVARKRLATAKKMLGGDEQKVFEEIHRAVWGYLGDKFSIPTAQLSKEYAGSILAEKNIRPELISDIIQSIDQCDLARYGGAFAGIKAADLYNNTERIITAIEEEVKS